MFQSNGTALTILERLRHQLAAQNAAYLPDQELLARYVSEHDEAAFTGLVNRHGPMVLALCRRILRHQQDAEDAFQAAFLVLARKAGAIRKHASIAAWLHSVAFRAANKLRGARTRRLARLTALVAEPAAAGDELASRDIQWALDEELNRLTDKYRAPLLLCCVQGLTRDEAAQQLGWSLGVLRGRLDRGREILRARLARRGVALAAVLLPLGVAGTSEAALVPNLLTATVTSVLAAAKCRNLATPAAALAQGVIYAMFWTKAQCVVLGLATLALLGTGAGVVFHAHAGDDYRDAFAQAKPAKQPAADSTADLRREIERLRLELEQTRLLLKLANQELLELRAARADAVDREKAANAEEQRARNAAQSQYLRAESARQLASTLLKQEQAFAKKPASQTQGVLSPDRKLLAVIEEKEAFALIDVATGQKLRQFAGHQGTVTALAFSPDARSLISSTKNSVSIWDLAGGKLLAKFSHNHHPIDSVNFTVDGNVIVIRSQGQTLELEARTGKLLRAAPQQ